MKQFGYGICLAALLAKAAFSFTETNIEESVPLPESAVQDTGKPTETEDTTAVKKYPWNRMLE